METGPGNMETNSPPNGTIHRQRPWRLNPRITPTLLPILYPGISITPPIAALNAVLARVIPLPPWHRKQIPQNPLLLLPIASQRYPRHGRDDIAIEIDARLRAAALLGVAREEEAAGRAGGLAEGRRHGAAVAAEGGEGAGGGRVEVAVAAEGCPGGV